jgi:hypothetical protein
VPGGLHFIKLREGSTKEDFSRVAVFLETQGGQIVLASTQRCWFIATLNQNLADDLKKMRKVEMVGGVTLRKREIKIIRTKL